MPYARITITLPEELVVALDAAAEAGEASRSAIVREATAAYLSERERAEAAEQRRAGVDELARALAEVRATRPLDDRPVLRILRELRGPLGDHPER